MKFNEWLSIRKIKEIAKKAKLDISKYDLNQIKQGFDVELEHGKKNPKTNVTNDDPTKTLKITLAHLDEKPNYYTKLKKVEE